MDIETFLLLAYAATYLVLHVLRSIGCAQIKVMLKLFLGSGWTGIVEISLSA
jgi:hypothetical protein